MKVQRLFALYRAGEGYPAGRIALELGISRSSVQRTLQMAHDDPEQFIILGFTVPMASADGSSFVCRFCGWPEEDAPPAAVHAFGHLFDPEELRIFPRPADLPPQS